MIYRKGNLLDVNHGLIVHGCNSQAVMGSGVALAVKNKYPRAFEQYQYDLRNIGVGDTSVFPVTEDKLYIISAITQQYYGRNSETKYMSYDAIDKCFGTICAYAHYKNLPIHIPKIGAGLGGGNWNVIEKIIDVNATMYMDQQVICWELE
jgi:O-acetyl-ADP-ribose deacetylase (regulator of RNase III)